MKKFVVPIPRLARLHYSTFINRNQLYSEVGNGAPISRSAYYLKLSRYAPGDEDLVGDGAGEDWLAEKAEELEI